MNVKTILIPVLTLTLINAVFTCCGFAQEDIFEQLAGSKNRMSSVTSSEQIEKFKEHLEEKYRDIRINGKFEEKLYNPFSDSYIYFSGEFTFMSDNMFRITTEGNDPMEICCDGEFIYIYIKNDSEVTRLSITDYPDLNFIDQFIPATDWQNDTSMTMMSDKKYTYLSVNPPAQPYFTHAEYLLNKKTLLPKYCKLIIADGTQIQVHFTIITKTFKLSKEDFNFEMPEGATLVTEPLSGGQVEGEGKESESNDGETNEIEDEKK